MWRQYAITKSATDISNTVCTLIDPQYDHWCHTYIHYNTLGDPIGTTTGVIHTYIRYNTLGDPIGTTTGAIHTYITTHLGTL